VAIILYGNQEVKTWFFCRGGSIFIDFFLPIIYSCGSRGVESGWELFSFSLICAGPFSNSDLSPSNTPRCGPLYPIPNGSFGFISEVCTIYIVCVFEKRIDLPLFLE
jgi:hypothetical protein